MAAPIARRRGLARAGPMISPRQSVMHSTRNGRNSRGHPVAERVQPEDPLADRDQVLPDLRVRHGLATAVARAGRKDVRAPRQQQVVRVTLARRVASRISYRVPFDPVLQDRPGVLDVVRLVVVDRMRHREPGEAQDRRERGDCQRADPAPEPVGRHRGHQPVADGRHPLPAASAVSTAVRASLAEVGGAAAGIALMRAEGSITAGTRALRRARLGQPHGYGIQNVGTRGVGAGIARIHGRITGVARGHQASSRVAGSRDQEQTPCTGWYLAVTRAGYA